MPIGAGADIPGVGAIGLGATGDTGATDPPAGWGLPARTGAGEAKGDAVAGDGVAVAGDTVLGSSGIGFRDGVGMSAGGDTGCGWIGA
jgi:hypothetical protein